MRKLLTLAAIALTLTVNAQQSDFFTPSRRTALRMPVTPIAVSDPYFSIWSPSDKLYDASTMHWSSATKSIIGVLRVDGKNYRFLGKPADKLIPYAEMAKSENWEAKYTRSTPDGNWTEVNYDDDKWQYGRGAFGDRDIKANATRWAGNNTDIYIRRYFNIDKLDKNSKVRLIYSHDDVFELFINGEKIVGTGETWLDDQTIDLTPAQIAKLHEGKMLSRRIATIPRAAHMLTSDFIIFLPTIHHLLRRQNNCPLMFSLLRATTHSSAGRLNLMWCSLHRSSSTISTSFQRL